MASYQNKGVQLAGSWPAHIALPGRNDYRVYQPRQVRVPLQQHVGKACQPMVEKGQAVRWGQPVGTSNEEMSALVHASVSGTVADIAEYPAAQGGKVLCVVIDNDGQDTPYTDGSADAAANASSDAGADARPFSAAGAFAAAGPAANADAIRQAVQRAGVVGMGGATFPTHVKLDTKGKPIHTLLVNGAECEPGLWADNCLMARHAGQVLRGALLALRAVGASQLVVGIEDDKPAAIAAMRAAASALASAQEGISVGVRTLPHLYPKGGEKQLIYALARREVPEGGLPADAGVVVVNVATAQAIAHAVLAGAPLTRRLCTVTGAVRAPGNLLVPVGTPAGEVIEACGGFVDTPSKLLLGGPMMGFAIENLGTPLTKASNGLVAVPQAEDFTLADTPCIRCNRCAEACPMALVPWSIDRYWRREKYDACRDFRAQSCINCGCCTYVCPAQRPLAEKITQAKNHLQKEDKEKSDG